MSDRMAVFADGRIEQVGPPAEVYEHPVNEFVADFVGVSNIVERDGRRFTIRPEKVRILDDAESANGLHVEEGRVEDVSYIGMVTRYVVELDRGGELLVVRQNLEMSSQEALEQRGRRVRVGRQLRPGRRLRRAGHGRARRRVLLDAREPRQGRQDASAGCHGHRVGRLSARTPVEHRR